MNSDIQASEVNPIDVSDDVEVLRYCEHGLCVLSQGDSFPYSRFVLHSHSFFAGQVNTDPVLIADNKICVNASNSAHVLHRYVLMIVQVVERGAVR